ncbi:tetratricopeptide (TPR) repeat protein [Labrenzia sp. EL_195]|nr:tetratricopeptide (TPR) repeat protein [Labrenzia sp. EL_195]
MGTQASKVYIQVLGSFSVVGADGRDYTPRGRKTCALLAMLAVSPDFRRSRKWLQDKLWSDRGTPQGAASLRQSLAEIRRAFGNMRDVFHSDHFHVSLNVTSVETDLTRRLVKKPQVCQGQEFLEGINIRDPAFEEWLREQRRVLDAQCGKIENQSFFERCSETEQSITNSVFIARSNGEHGDYSDRVLDAVGQTLVETGTVSLRDLRNNDDGQLQLTNTSQDDVSVLVRASVINSHNGAIHHVKVSAISPEERVLWASTKEPAKPSQRPYDENLMISTNQISSICINETVQQVDPNLDGSATVLCSRAIDHLYKLGGPNFEIADRLFAQAFELSPKGIYLGWRAYTRTFMLAERQFGCRKTLLEEAETFLARAFELDPYNSYIASFAAQVHNIIHRSYVAAYEFAQRSVDLNRSNAIGWSQLGAAKCHLGKAKSGFEDTQYSVRIAGTAPFRFQLAGMSCIAGTMAHDLDGAIHAGEIGHALAPKFGPPLRYLSVLYFRKGEIGKSREVFEKLREVEPDFSFSILRDHAYPAAGLRYSGFLEDAPSIDV